MLAMKSRIPQVTSLDDPVFQSTTWPFPRNGPQYTMGYALYEMIMQEFPWFGTLAVRGQVAEQEVRSSSSSSPLASWRRSPWSASR